MLVGKFSKWVVITLWCVFMFGVVGLVISLVSMHFITSAIWVIYLVFIGMYARFLNSNFVIEIEDSHIWFKQKIRWNIHGKSSFKRESSTHICLVFLGFVYMDVHGLAGDISSLEHALRARGVSQKST